MKLAIIISGHIRLTEFATKNIISLKKKFPEAHIFIQTWNEHENKTYRSPDYIKKGSCDQDNFLTKIEAKKFCIEDQNKKRIPEKIKCAVSSFPESMRPAVSGFFFMVYGIERGFSLIEAQEKKQGWKYEFIMRYRFDLKVECMDSLIKDLANLQCIKKSIILSTSVTWWPYGAFSDVYFLIRRSDIERLFILSRKKVIPAVYNFCHTPLFIPEVITTNIIRESGLNIIESYGLFYLMRKERRLQKISKGKLSLTEWFNQLRFCWFKLQIPYRAEWPFVKINKNPARDSWHKHSPFFLRSVNLTRAIFGIIEAVNKAFKLITRIKKT